MERTLLTKETNRRTSQSGFTIIQVVITLAIIVVVSVFGIAGIINARAEMRVQNSARLFAVYIEKARADSVRRHAGTGQEAVVQTFNPGSDTFTVTMDFDGTGTVQTRTFKLDHGVFFSTVAQTASFDWRGRVVERLAFQVSNGSKSIPVDVSGSGDITVDDQIFADDAIPPVIVTQVIGDQVPDPTPLPTATPTPEPNPSDSPTPVPTPTPNGNGNGNGGNGNGGNGNGGNPHNTPTPTPTATPTPTPTPPVDPGPTPTPTPNSQCSSSANKTNLVLSQSNAAQKTGTVIYSIANNTSARSVTASVEGGGNSLLISVSPASVSGNASVTVTITAKNGSGNRGTFLVKISSSPACGSDRFVAVTVGN